MAKTKAFSGGALPPQSCLSSTGKQPDDKTSKDGKEALLAVAEPEGPKTPLKPLGWNPYTKRESSEIVHWLAEHNEYQRLGTHVLWR